MKNALITIILFASLIAALFAFGHYFMGAAFDPGAEYKGTFGPPNLDRQTPHNHAPLIVLLD